MTPLLLRFPFPKSRSIWSTFTVVVRGIFLPFTDPAEDTVRLASRPLTMQILTLQMRCFKGSEPDKVKMYQVRKVETEYILNRSKCSQHYKSKSRGRAVTNVW